MVSIRSITIQTSPVFLETSYQLKSTRTMQNLNYEWYLLRLQNWILIIFVYFITHSWMLMMVLHLMLLQSCFMFYVDLYKCTFVDAWNSLHLRFDICCVHSFQFEQFIVILCYDESVPGQNTNIGGVLMTIGATGTKRGISGQKMTEGQHQLGNKLAMLLI